MGLQSRIEYVDVCKCFAIFCVILGHSVNDEFDVMGNYTWLYEAIYSFHMPLFMTLSGYFIGHSFNTDLRCFIAKRSRQLLLPVFTFSVCAFLFSILTSIDITNGLSFINYFFGGDMWFLKYLFACSLIAVVSKKLFKSTIVACLLPTILLIALTRNNIFRLLPFLWLGYFLNCKQLFLQKYSSRIAFCSIALWLFLLCFWQIEYDSPLWRWITIKDGVTVNWHSLLVVVYRFAIGCAGSILFLSVFQRFVSDAKPWKFLARCGQRTLGVYCLQIYFLEKALDGIVLPPMGAAASGALILAVAIGEFAFCECIVALLERYRLTRLLFLGISQSRMK